MVKEKEIKVLDDLLSQKEEGLSYLHFAYLFYGRRDLFRRWLYYGQPRFSYDQLVRLKDELDGFLPIAQEVGFQREVKEVLDKVESSILTNEPSLIRLKRNIRKGFSHFWKFGLILFVSWIFKLCFDFNFNISFFVLYSVFFIYSISKLIWREISRKIDEKIYQYYTPIIRHLKEKEIQDEWNRADTYFTENLE